MKYNLSLRVSLLALLSLLLLTACEEPIDATTQLAINRGAHDQLIEGARIGLQQMVVGDEAEIIIPWYLGYGERRSGEINPYSALKFRVKLEEIIPESQRSAVAKD